ncbi:MAG: DUF58 domain-containing protein [Armatimonadetes bacterium]|nr:DUF58 domain-containing protein [Armatimonadota bacterium]
MILISGRLVLLCLLGAIPLLFLSHPLSFLLLYNGAILALFATDAWILIAASALRISRQCDSKFALGEYNRVTLILDNPSRTWMRGEVRDDYPDPFTARGDDLPFALPPFSSLELHYEVLAPERGNFRFGKFHVKLQGPLGMTVRLLVLPGEQEIKVYPNIRGLSKFDLLARRGRLTEVGMKSAKVYGVGTEFDSLREYQPDDEYRKINWKATARKGKLITQHYEIERSQNLVILLDAGRMMASQIGDMSKLDHAVNAALILSYVAAKKDDRVGLLVFADQIRSYLPPGKGKRQISLIAEALYNVKSELVEPDYGTTFRYLAHKCRKRSLIVVFTDLVDSEESAALFSYLGSLYPVHLPVCVAMSDPLIQNAADQPPASLETVYRKAVAEQVVEQRERTLSLLKGRGVLVVDSPPSEITPSVINKYLEIKIRSML